VKAYDLYMLWFYGFIVGINLWAGIWAIGSGDRNPIISFIIAGVFVVLALIVGWIDWQNMKRDEANAEWDAFAIGLDSLGKPKRATKFIDQNIEKLDRAYRITPWSKTHEDSEK
jgi:hypothetical protein